MTLVSVIIPSYNRKELLARAIRSVLAQGFSDMEVVVVDDGSTDATSTLATEFNDSRLRWVYQSNSGVSAARNNGVAFSLGEWLLFLDSDDVLREDFFQHVGPQLLSEKDIIFIGARILINGVEIKTIIPSRPYGRPSNDGLFLAGTFIVRRKWYHLAGGYDPQIEYGENTELSFRLQKHLRAKTFIDLPLLLIHQAGFRTSNTPQKIYKSINYMINKNKEFFRLNPAIHFLYLSNMGVASLRMGDQETARKLFLRAVDIRPLNVKAWFRLIISFLPAYSFFYKKAG